MEFYSNIVECLLSKRNILDKALIYGKEGISYQDLCEYVINYSYHFSENEVVGILCTNNIEFVVSYFAVLMAKGIALLLNKELKWAEIQQLCEQCNSKRIVTSEKIVESDTKIKIEIVRRSCFEGNNGIGKLFDSYDEDAVITLLPTSGTTDQAKIVSLTHRSFVKGIYNTLYFSNRKKDDIELILLSFATRTALEGQLLTGVALGMQIVLYDGMLLPRKVHKIIEEQKITFCSLTPSLFCLIFKDYKHVKSLRSLDSIVVVGEKLSDVVLENFRQECNHINLLYGYGMTETGPIAFKNKDNCRIRLNSVGKILEDNTAFLKNVSFDEKGNQNGEIVVCCSSMMQGYYNKGMAIDEKYIFTGDIGHFDEEGYLYIDGRIKNIINYNGYKVFPEEIEGIISGLKGISDVLVKGEIDSGGAEIVVAYVVVSDEMTVENVLRHCRKHLAEYKVPKKINFCREIDKIGASQKKKRTQ